MFLFSCRIRLFWGFVPLALKLKFSLLIMKKYKNIRKNKHRSCHFKAIYLIIFDLNFSYVSTKYVTYQQNMNTLSYRNWSIILRYNRLNSIF